MGLEYCYLLVKEILFLCNKFFLLIDEEMCFSELNCIFKWFKIDFEVDEINVKYN